MAMNPSEIEIYNLGPNYRNLLTQTKQRLSVVLNVKWANTDRVKLFSGTILASTTSRQGADIVTKLYCLSGYGAVSKSLLSSQWGKGTKLTKVITEAAKGLGGGVTIDTNSFQINDKTLGNQGLSFAGTGTDLLNKLARTYGFSWTIYNGVLQVVGDQGKSIPQAPGAQLVVSPDNGFLLRVEPMLATPFQLKKGVTIYSLLLPTARPGNLVRVESGLNDSLSGSYRIHSINHVGDTHADMWETMIESYQTGQGL
jgi:hypothetical protein